MGGQAQPRLRARARRAGRALGRRRLDRPAPSLDAGLRAARQRAPTSAPRASCCTTGSTPATPGCCAPRWPAAPDLPAGTLLYRRSVAGGRDVRERRHRRAAAVPARARAGARLRRRRPRRGTSPSSTARNLAGRSLDDGRWARRPFDEVGDRLGHDRAFYAGLRNGTPRGAAPRGGAGGRRRHARGVLPAWDGYGLMAEYLALGMQRAGAVGRPRAARRRPRGHERRAPGAARRVAPGAGGPALWLAPPESARADARRQRRPLHQHDVGERPPPAGLGGARSTRPAPSSCRPASSPTCSGAAGVSAPIEVVPEGVDPGPLPVRRASRARGDHDARSSACSCARKHIAEAVAAWQRAFAGDPQRAADPQGQARSCRSRPTTRASRSSSETEPHARASRTGTQRADVLLALGNEGFGLPLVEGMATGLPVDRAQLRGTGRRLRGRRPAGARRAARSAGSAATTRTSGRPACAASRASTRWPSGCAGWRTHRDEARDAGARGVGVGAPRAQRVGQWAPAVLDVMERRLAAGRCAGLRTAVADRRGVAAAATSPRSSRGSTTCAWSRAAARDRGPAAAARPARGRPGRRRRRRGARSSRPRSARVPVVVTEHCRARAHRRLGARRDRAGRDHERRRARRCAAAGRPSGSSGSRTAARPALHDPDARGRDAIAIVGEAPGAERAAAPSAAAAWCCSRRASARSPSSRGCSREHCDVVVFADAARAAASTSAPRSPPASRWSLPPIRGWPTSTGAILPVGRRRRRTPCGLLDDVELRRELGAAAREYCHDHSWDRVAQRHVALWTALEAT